MDDSLSAAQIKKVCGIWTGTHWVDADTDDTIVEIKVGNAKHDGFCGSVMPIQK